MDGELIPEFICKNKFSRIARTIFLLWQSTSNYHFYHF